MNQRALVVTVALVVLLAGGFLLFNLLGPEPGPPRTASTRPAPAPVLAPPTTLKPEEPAPEPGRRVARRPLAPKAAPAPSATEPVAAAPELGILNIDSDVSGAQVFIDREFVGATPLVVQGVSPGTHRLNVSAQGYDGIVNTIEVAAGPRDILIKLKEVRLEVQIDVVHKHRLGSCRGRLVARPQGIRYETDDKDDAFASGLLDLETFQVDYLEKNLRVQARKGKRYDFTDPDGNADRLFVFHRDVDKARERLRKGDPPSGQ